jgi:hypothetical protein
MKRLFADWAKRHDLTPIRSHYDAQPGTAQLVQRKGRYGVEVCTTARQQGMTCGWDYPLLNADEDKAVAFFARD